MDEKHYDTGDMLRCIRWIGSNVRRLGIPEEYIGDYTVYIKGTLFSAGGTGWAYFNTGSQDSGVCNMVSLIYLYCDELSYGSCEERLKEVYGEPYAIGEEPYTRINGGAVHWTMFSADNVSIRLSKASGYDHIEINVKRKEDT